MKELIKELSISVACLLDDDGLITAEVKDIEHIQDLVTKLEDAIDPVEKGKQCK